MPAHQRLRLEDNRGFEQGREQPIEPDEDHAIGSAQPEPHWRRPPQDNKLMPEKYRLGFASRMRSEHSDEQSAEQLQEVDHPEERITIGAGKTFDANALSPDMRKAVEDGMAEAWQTFKEPTTPRMGEDAPHAPFPRAAWGRFGRKKDSHSL
jgi:hypothetical protein